MQRLCRQPLLCCVCVSDGEGAELSQELIEPKSPEHLSKAHGKLTCTLSFARSSQEMMRFQIIGQVMTFLSPIAQIPLRDLNLRGLSICSIQQISAVACCQAVQPVVALNGVIAQ